MLNLLIRRWNGSLLKRFSINLRNLLRGLNMEKGNQSRYENGIHQDCWLRLKPQCHKAHHVFQNYDNWHIVMQFFTIFLYLYDFSLQFVQSFAIFCHHILLMLKLLCQSSFLRCGNILKYILNCVRSHSKKLCIKYVEV